MIRAVAAAILLSTAMPAEATPFASNSHPIASSGTEAKGGYARAAPSASGDTPLITAARKGRTEAVERLLAAGADVGAVDEHGADALIRGVQNPTIVQLLLTAGADPRHSDDYGHTALMLAAATDARESARLLLDAGAYLNASDGHGFTALDRARLAGRDQLAAWLVGIGAEEGTVRLRSPNSRAATVRGGTLSGPKRDWAAQLVIDDLRPPPETTWTVRFWMEAIVLVGLSLLFMLATRHTGTLRLEHMLLPLLCLGFGIWLTRWVWLAAPATLGDFNIPMVLLSVVLVAMAARRQRLMAAHRAPRSDWGTPVILLAVGIWVTGYFWYRVGQQSYGLEGIPIYAVALFAPWWLPLLLGLLVWSIGRMGQRFGANVALSTVGRLSLAALAAGWIGSGLQEAQFFGRFHQSLENRFDRLGLHEATALTVTSELDRSRIYAACESGMTIPPDVERFMAANVVHDGRTARLTVQIPFCTREQIADQPSLTNDFRAASAELAERRDVERVVIDWILEEGQRMRENVRPRA